MNFINRVNRYYRVAADILDLKPRLKDKRLLDKEAHLMPKFDEATLKITNSNTYAYQYELVATVPVPAPYIRDKKKDNMGAFIQQLHSFIENKIGKWMGTPSIGGHTVKAQRGMLNIQATWHFNDAFLAYALGLNLAETFGGNEVVDKTQITTRMHKAEKAFKDMKSYRSNALKKLKLRSQDEEERNKIWKEEFMNDFVSMTERYKKEGISYAMLSQSDQQESRHSAHASAPERAPENLGVRMEKALEVLKKDKKMEDIMKELSSINSEFRRTLTNKEALELEKKEAALVKKADDREKELGVKIFHGFPYI